MTLTLQINGVDRAIISDPATPLIYVLRNELGLKGAKLGCGLEQCGCCAVLVDGEAALSCATPAAAFDGKAITTVEGLRDHATGARVQDAFVEAGAAQCGYCTAGLVVAATALLTDGGRPGRDEAKAALAPHLCRCGSHSNVLKAIAILTGDER